jgi:hypothetical protein
MLLIIGLGCASSGENAEKNIHAETKNQQKEEPKKLDRYTLRGIVFVYYKIPAGLDQEELIEVAQTLHDEEPAAQLILVDDDSKVAEYIDYAKKISTGDAETRMPKEWADKHIVANVQKYMSGKFVLCLGRGFEEIAELK